MSRRLGRGRRQVPILWSGAISVDPIPFTIDIAQVAGSVSATLFEQYDFTVGVTQAAGSVSATLLTNLQVEIAVAQASGSVSALLDQQLGDFTVIDVTQTAGSVSVTLLTLPGTVGTGWGTGPWGSMPWGSYAPSDAIDITYRTVQYLRSITHAASLDPIRAPAELDTTVGPRTAAYARSVSKIGSP